jgi:hypothetical protein
MTLLTVTARPKAVAVPKSFKGILLRQKPIRMIKIIKEQK